LTASPALAAFAGLRDDELPRVHLATIYRLRENAVDLREALDHHIAATDLLIQALRPVANRISGVLAAQARADRGGGQAMPPAAPPPAASPAGNRPAPPGRSGLARLALLPRGGEWASVAELGSTPDEKRRLPCALLLLRRRGLVEHNGRRARASRWRITRAGVRALDGG